MLHICGQDPSKFVSECLRQNCNCHGRILTKEEQTLLRAQEQDQDRTNGGLFRPRYTKDGHTFTQQYFQA